MSATASAATASAAPSNVGQRNASSDTPAATTAAPPLSEQQQQRRQRRRPPKKKAANRTNGPDVATATATTTAADTTASTAPKAVAARPNDKPHGPSEPASTKKTPSKSSRRRNNRRKDNTKTKDDDEHSWWRKQVPVDAVDPITLDPLEDLKYPPFALVGLQPYEPIDWPPLSIHDPSNESGKSSMISEEQRQRQILQQQWGSLTGSPPAIGDQPRLPDPDQDVRHVNLFDGRALAYYMVSQLQFIDPLNRRDLVRDELVHLDRYLRRHGFIDINVTEAYDAKGITISTAGSAATTDTGRASILQQEARVLLNALFGTHHQRISSSHMNPSSTSSTAAPSTTLQGSSQRSNNRRNNGQQNSFMQQYEAYQSFQEQRPVTRQGNRTSSLEPANQSTSDGLVHGFGGLVIIDDDENPGLRGTAAEFVPSMSLQGNTNTLYSANHIVRQHGRHRGQTIVPEQEFPTLAPPAAANASTSHDPSSTTSPDDLGHVQPKKVLPKAKTLSKIGKMVQKTTPEEQQRQWDAREEARRKAALVALQFGGVSEMRSNLDPLTAATTATATATMSTAANAGPSEALLDRNRAFADALGVKPAALRSNGVIRSGWMRPLEGNVEVDEFGNELNIVYPDALVQQAKEIRLDALLKLEKKWKAFLADDTAASLPLNPMDRSMRAMVHEYAAFWKLHTESFDPEPKRYIHCVKLRDTSAPHPLLSDVLENWKLYRPASAAIGSPLSLDHSSQQTAGQPTWAARELPTGPSRVPLSLKPRSVESALMLSSSVGPNGASLGGAPSLTMSDAADANMNSRFSALADGRERPKLELSKRTLPTELPPFETTLAGQFDAAEELERQRERHRVRAQREEQEAQQKQRALAAAFDSDDEDNASGGRRRYKSEDSDSEWEEQQAAYTGSDEE